MAPLSVPGTLDSLGIVAEFVQAAAASAGLDKKTAYRFRLAVDEIVTNIVTHGYAEAGLNGTVDLRFELDDDTVKISIEDSGVAFDPLQHVPPDDLDLPLEQRDVGGLGIYLVVHSVDQFLYERVGERNRNILIMDRTANLPAHLPSDGWARR